MIVKGSVVAVGIMLCCTLGACEKKNVPTTQSVAAVMPAPPTFITGRGMRVIVVDKATNEPLPDERFTFYINGQKTNDFTNAFGIYDIELPAEGLRQLTVHARPKRNVPTIRSWYAQDGSELKDLPAEYVLAVEPGSTLGGFVKDEAGKPIEGATVVIRVTNSSSPEHPDLDHSGYKTDTTGKWRCEIAPSEIHTLRAVVRHPEYYQGWNFQPISLEDARRESVVLTLRNSGDLSSATQPAVEN